MLARHFEKVKKEIAAKEEPPSDASAVTTAPPVASGVTAAPPVASDIATTGSAQPVSKSVEGPVQNQPQVRKTVCFKAACLAIWHGKHS